MLAVYIATNQFRVTGDLTGEFTTGRRIKANCGVDGYKYSTIESSSYSSYTTVTITENVLTSNLEDVLYGIINIGPEGSFPDHTHDGTEGQGGQISYITDAEFITYSGSLQTQIDNKPDTFLDLTDTPNSYSNGLFAQSTNSGIVWTSISGGTSNVQSFLDLNDTPDTYLGTVGKFAQSTGSGISWVTLSGSGVYDVMVSTKDDLSGGLVTETWSKNTGDLYPNFMDDTYIDRYNWDGSHNHNSETQLYFSNIAYTDLNNTLFKFYIKDCIGTKNITSAILKLYCTDASSDPISVYRVLKNWQPTEVTWNNYTTASGWSTAGCSATTSFPVDDSPTADRYDQPICTVSSVTLSQWFTMDITSIVQAWSTNAHNEYGIILVGSLTNYSIGKSYSNEGTDGFRPELEISYYSDAMPIDDLVDGRIAITIDEYYNTYILNKSLAKWIVSDGNKYQLTSDLPTDSAFVINIGTRVYDMEIFSWREWDGDSWEIVDYIDTFLYLSDTPNTYSGTSGMFAQSTGSGIIWTSVSGGVGTTDHGELIGLEDDDHSQYIRHNLAIAENDFLVGAPSPFGTFNKKSLNETRELLGVTGSGIVLSQTFLGLTDTPSLYSNGLYAQSTTSGIVWATVSGGSGVSTFLELTDTPSSYSNGKFAQSTEDGIIWTTVSGGGTGASYGELELTYSSNIVLDFTTYNLQSVILTGNTNFTFTNMTNGKPCILNVIQDAQGSRSATFQSNIKWPQGVIPTTSSGSGLNDIFTFIQSRGTIYGDCSKAFQLGS